MNEVIDNIIIAKLLTSAKHNTKNEGKITKAIDLIILIKASCKQEG